MTEAGVRERVVQEIKVAGGAKALAEKWGVSAGYLCDIVNGRRAPGPKILDPLGVKRIATIEYKPAKGKR